MFNFFELDYLDDFCGGLFVCYIILDDMFRKLVIVVNLFLKGIVFIKNIFIWKYDFLIVEVCVLEVNVVFGGVYFFVIKKVDFIFICNMINEIILFFLINIYLFDLMIYIYFFLGCFFKWFFWCEWRLYY